LYFQISLLLPSPAKQFCKFFVNPNNFYPNFFFTLCWFLFQVILFNRSFLSESQNSWSGDVEKSREGVGKQ